MNLANWYCWVILASAAVTAAVSVVGLVADSYRETLLENITLCLVAMASVVVVLQIHTHGAAQGSGFAFLSLAVACYSVAKLLKARGECAR
jgi:hypothetical protein